MRIVGHAASLPRGPRLRYKAPVSLARRVALAMTLASFIGLSAWELSRTPRHPYMDLDNRFSDHFSHLNTARLFPRLGLDIWRVPLREVLSRATPQDRAALPADVVCSDCIFIVPGWSKAVLVNWPHVRRPYPPGDLVLVAPLAALYHFTDISFTAMNRLLIVLFLFAAHLGLFLLFDALFAAGAFELALPALLGASTALHWTLNGFYDGALLVPLVLCWRFLGQRRGLAALVAYCAAAFLHYRAYFYGPWALWALWLIVRDKQWRTWGRAGWAAAAAGAFMGAASLGTWILTLPSMIGPPMMRTALQSTSWEANRAPVALALITAALCLAAFAAARAWLDAAMLISVGAIVTRMPSGGHWYAVSLVPWLCAAVGGRRAPLVAAGRTLAFLFLCFHVWREDPLPAWIANLVTR